MKLSTKARIRVAIRNITDAFSGTRFAGERPLGEACRLKQVLELSQPFKPSETLAGKIHNLTEAARCINRVTVLPGEVFSFWRAVGNPNDSRRFTYGRSIHNGVQTKDFGGGLCQASGIMHHAALLAGLEVVERFNHSVDLYTDETRFAPLGTDATVFYGFKDLRIRNNTGSPIKFELMVENVALRLVLHGADSMRRRELDIVICEAPDGVKDVKVRDAAGCVVSTSVYQPLNIVKRDEKTD